MSTAIQHFEDIEVLSEACLLGCISLEGGNRKETILYITEQFPIRL